MPRPGLSPITLLRYDPGGSGHDQEHRAQAQEGEGQGGDLGDKPDERRTRQDARVSDRGDRRDGQILRHGLLPADRGVQDRDDVGSAEAHQGEAEERRRGRRNQGGRKKTRPPRISFPTTMILRRPKAWTMRSPLSLPTVIATAKAA